VGELCVVGRVVGMGVGFEPTHTPILDTHSQLTPILGR